ncbi:MAG: NAD(P)/FAD-dependent oxidoreductase [Phycisphaerales bacterium JB060]
MTVPYWQRSTRPQAIDVDAAVVGGGVCGLSAALHLLRRGLSVVVLERHMAGSGASSRNAGFLMRGMAESYKVASDTLGSETARNIWRWSEENLLGLQSEGAAELPSYRHTPSCLLALDQAESDDLVASASMLQADGFGVLLTESGADSAWASGLPILGLVNPGDATVNPAELVELLSAKLGSAILPGQEVYQIDPSAGAEGRCVVRTAGATVRCRHVLVCTNAYAGVVLPDLASMVRPNRGQMLALSAEGARLDYAYYANRGHEYIRQTPDGTIVVGGCRNQFAEDERTLDDAWSEAVQGAIESFARMLLDRPIRVTARWAGTMGFSPDGMPLVGPVSNDGSIWFCGGFTGHGMSLAYRTAAGAVAAMLDGPDADPLSGTFALGRAGVFGGV